MSSKKDKAMIVRGAGLLTSIFTGLEKEVKKQGGEEVDIHYLTTPEGQYLLSDIAKLIVEAGLRERNIFSVTVDYSQSLEDMIKVGNYDRVSDNITSKHFPLEGSGKKQVKIKIFHFNRCISSKDAIIEMRRAGCRPALVEELVALGSKYKELQRQFDINALGSIWQDEEDNNTRHVPCLPWDDEKCRLGIGYLASDWAECWRFAAVSNAS